MEKRVEVKECKRVKEGKDRSGGLEEKGQWKVEKYVARHRLRSGRGEANRE